jgi:hypothetical protein
MREISWPTVIALVATLAFWCVVALLAAIYPVVRLALALVIGLGAILALGIWHDGVCERDGEARGVWWE